MANDWTQTLTNKKLDPRRLKPEMVGGIEEIAHSLAHGFRFNRMTARPYSVAEHCVRGAQLLPAAFAGAFLLHELSEVYLPDIPAPLKPFLLVETQPDSALISWANLERQHTRAILEALGLLSIEPLIYSPEVRHMDLAMLAAEKRDLIGPEPEPWNLPVEPVNNTVIVPWDSETAAIRFVNEFKRLFGDQR